MLNDNSLKIKMSTSDLLIYLVLVPFLYPRGFTEYSVAYKLFFTGWMYLTIVIIFFIFIYNLCQSQIKYDSCFNWMLLYHAYMLIITLILQGGITEGLQKLFAAPALCFICINLLQKRTERFIECLANILIVNFILNLTIFNSFIATSYFSIANNIMFIGHVQVASQLGILGIFTAYIMEKINPKQKNKSRILILLSILIMMMSLTSASYICMIMMLFGVIILKFIKNKKILELESKWYVILILGINGFLFWLLNVNEWNLSKYGIHTTFNGRMAIWNEITELLKSHFIFGYGVYGVRIQVYWSVWSSRPEGMTYAHSQIFQLLLDGGIILLAIFTLMLFSYISKIKKSKDKTLIWFSNICLIVTLAVMISESTTEYYYIFIFWSILAYLPKISAIVKK